jgi:hypothetical protein
MPWSDWKLIVEKLPLWRAGFHFGRPQDPHEAARIILDCDDFIHVACRGRYCAARHLNDVFRMQIADEKRCTEPTCSFANSLEDIAGDVQLTVRPQDLQGLVDDYQDASFLADDADYHCPKCSGLVQKRLLPTPMGGAAMLQLNRFVHSGLRCDTGRKSFTKVPFSPSLLLGGAEFEFAGVVQHEGVSKNSGHYIAYTPQAP